MKRPDIQGLRTLAILAVLLFHIWPLTFPSGFLGVDVFFVISGLLMAQCLSNIGSDFRLLKIRDKILHFYSRRIHRIVPLYLALICGTASIARTLMLDSDFQKARSDMFWALGFATNLEAMFASGEDYFAEIFAYRPFLHTWSLGVEMQFYLLAPVLMLLLMAINHRMWRFALCGLLLLISVAVQQFLSRWDQTVAFGLVFCRLWQFFAGIFVFFLIDLEQAQDQGSAAIVWPFVLAQPADPCPNQSSLGPAINGCSLSSPCPSSTQKERLNLRRLVLQQVLSHLLLLLLLAILLLPLGLPAPLQSLQSTFVVLLTALLLFLHKNAAEWPAPALLSNFVSVFLGDLSYAWYLVHWPAILFVKYFFTIDSFSLASGIGIFLLSLVLAVLVDRLLDSHFRKLPNFCAVSFIIGLFYTFCFFIILPTFYSGQIERIATAKDFDGSLGGRAVTVNVDFVKLMIDEMRSSESHARLGSTLSLYEKIRMNELIQSATFDDRYKILPPDEIKSDNWTRQFAAMVPEERNFLKAVNERKMQGSGNQTWLLLGNSHADVISRELQAEFRDRFSLFQMFTVPGCVPFFVPERLSFVTPDHQLPFKTCTAYSQLVKQAVESIKPDVLFIAFRWYGAFQEVPFEGDQDQLLALFHAFLHSVQPHVGQQIFFPAPNLLFKYETAKELAKRLWQGTPLADLHLSYKQHLELNRWSYQRLERLNCPKCRVYDLAEQFCSAETDKCLAFDEKTQLALFFDNNHLSYLGRQRVRPFLRAQMPRE